MKNNVPKVLNPISVYESTMKLQWKGRNNRLRDRLKWQARKDLTCTEQRFSLNSEVDSRAKSQKEVQQRS